MLVGKTASWLSKDGAAHLGRRHSQGPLLHRHAAHARPGHCSLDNNNRLDHLSTIWVTCFSTTTVSTTFSICVTCLLDDDSLDHL